MKVISLFSGAGGLDLGLIQSGHQIVWANDNDLDAVTTYRANVSKHIEYADIADIEPRALPDASVVVGGFPCQGFSQANLQRWEGDERNKMFSYFVRTLRAKQPEYFIAENVRGILSLGGGVLLERILGSLKRCGYRVSYHLVNAADYGVPQNRLRVLFLGTRRDVASDQQLVLPIPSHANPLRANALCLKPWVTIGETLACIPEPNDAPDIPNHVYSQYKVAYRNFTGHRKTDPNKPSPTILARGNGKGGVCAIPHPFRSRRMSVRESALVQTFPMDFRFSGTLNSMYRQVGNAVPVRVGAALGHALSCAGGR